MSTLLTDNGHKVRLADSVAAALKAAEEERFDILLCDLGLPDGDALERLIDSYIEPVRKTQGTTK